MTVETIHVLNELVPVLTAADIEAGCFCALLRDRFGVIPQNLGPWTELASCDRVAVKMK